MGRTEWLGTGSVDRIKRPMGKNVLHAGSKFQKSSINTKLLNVLSQKP